MDLSQANDIRALPVSELRVGSTQPRRSFDLERLSELAESIREHGVLQPLLVRSVDGHYEIVAGERRWRAAQLAGLSEIPVVVRQLSDEQARAAALIENLQRDNLNVIDEVDGKLELVALTLGLEREQARKRLMQLLRTVPGDEHERLDQVFRSMGETWRTFAKNKLRILNWPQPVLEALRAGLPLTLGSVVAGAPEDRQAELLELAQNGASPFPPDACPAVQAENQSAGPRATCQSSGKQAFSFQPGRTDQRNSGPLAGTDAGATPTGDRRAELSCSYR